MPEKRSVGLIVFMHLPPDGLVAILQKRGEINDENLIPESYPGGSQLTVWGGVKDEETYEEALRREIGEEAGWVWLADFFIARNEGKRIIHLENPSVTGGNTSAWAVHFPVDSLKTLRLNAATGGPIKVTEKQLPLIQDLKANYKRDSGVLNRAIIAMFSDSKEILKKGFAWAKTLNP
ncbi:MAG: NUDIX domain-containing protein [bacterium]|nr:NUDIX domain-containing protein [bacterium]